MKGSIMGHVRALDYNKRIFGAGLYGSHHRARFDWLRKKAAMLPFSRISVLELGCFDAKSLDYLPSTIDRYVGLDAGWESGVRNGVCYGLAAAEARYAGNARYQFITSTSPRDLVGLSETFDIGISMETFEHIPPEQIDEYLSAIAGRLRGPLFITVPNEKGLSLLFKNTAALVLRTKRDSYTAKEFIHAVCGRLDRVERDQHKGFDYRALSKSLQKHFDAVTVEGIGFGRLPPSLQLTVGIVAQSRRQGLRHVGAAA
jgi:hypothetical protein